MQEISTLVSPKTLGRTNQHTLKSARSVGRNTKRHSQQEANTAILIAGLRQLGEQNVYATTTSSGWFVANGVVVSNCDALRYVIMMNNPMRHVSIYDKMNMHIERQRNLTNKAR
jgi:hypothetical protein